MRTNWNLHLFLISSHFSATSGLREKVVPLFPLLNIHLVEDLEELGEENPARAGELQATLLAHAYMVGQQISAWPYNDPLCIKMSSALLVSNLT